MSSPPMHTQSAESSPTLAAGRARLQKKSRMAMDSHTNSSPIVPTLDTSSPSPRQQQQHPPRHYASDYPLRERENVAYGNYGNSSPTYGGNNRSPLSGIPPPVPGKIPIDRGQEDWAMDGGALSEELRSIDIGVGSGHRARVRRYGF